jgi:hypothetical protein
LSQLPRVLWTSDCWHHERTLYSRRPLNGDRSFYLSILDVNYVYKDVLGSQTIMEDAEFEEVSVERWVCLPMFWFIQVCLIIFWKMGTCMG